MDVSKFIDDCLASGYEWSEGEHNGAKGYFVGSKKLDTAAHFTLDAIEQNSWPTLEKEIVQGRDVHHVTRVVGYYSRIENWNKSKHGELRDRHAGDYKIK